MGKPSPEVREAIAKAGLGGWEQLLSRIRYGLTDRGVTELHPVLLGEGARQHKALTAGLNAWADTWLGRESRERRPDSWKMPYGEGMPQSLVEFKLLHVVLEEGATLGSAEFTDFVTHDDKQLGWKVANRAQLLLFIGHVELTQFDFNEIVVIPPDPEMENSVQTWRRVTTDGINSKGYLSVVPIDAGVLSAAVISLLVCRVEVGQAVYPVEIDGEIVELGLIPVRGVRMYTEVSVKLREGGHAFADERHLSALFLKWGKDLRLRCDKPIVVWDERDTRYTLAMVFSGRERYTFDRFEIGTAASQFSDGFALYVVDGMDPMDKENDGSDGWYDVSLETAVVGVFVVEGSMQERAAIMENDGLLPADLLTIQAFMDQYPDVATEHNVSLAVIN